MTKKKVYTSLIVTNICIFFISSCLPGLETHFQSATSTPILTETCTPTPENTETELPTQTPTATPDPVITLQNESLTGIKEDFLLAGKLRINQKSANKDYVDFINSLATNKQNKDYMVKLLGANPYGEKLLSFLRKNDYILPPGLNLPYQSRGGYVKLGNNPIKDSIKLDTIKIVVFGPEQWNSDLGGVKEYIASLKSYAGFWVVSNSSSIQYFGWGIDLRDDRLVFVAGSKDNAIQKYPHTEKMTIGGYTGTFDFDRDSSVASGEIIQINKVLKKYNDRTGNVFTVVSVLASLCGEQITSGICEEDISQLFGLGKNLFDPVE